ncbi:protein translocase subunit SecD, partial [Candidatus Parcubacteria bacterium]|nr:protein translocase subunit SecD [Patescibacteria group bacterium]MCG2686600.1 protein translocase subunit SecD [Candidatus Parcubacteria bacterium]
IIMTTQNKNRSKILAIFILAFFCALIVWPTVPANTPFENFWNKTKFHLGLDLQGGTHLVYQADVSEIPSDDRASAVEGVRDVIERRVNAFGVAEPVVQTNKVGGEYRVIIELAGIKDVNSAIAMIGETPLLEFKEQDPNFQEELTPEQADELDEFNKQTQSQAQDILTKVLQPGANFAEYAKEYSQDPGSAEKGGDLGFVKRGMFVPEFDQVIFDKQAESGVYPQLVQSQFGYHIINKLETRGEAENLEVHSSHILFKTKSEQDYLGETQWLRTDLSGKHLARAQVQFDPQTGEPEVGLEFNDEGKDLFAEITTRNVGKPVAIFLDGFAISIPTVNEPIREGNAVISGRFNIQEAKELVQRLNAGALPVPIEIISQQTVGASLGEESVDKSLIAGLIGLLAVAIFMILFYRLPGLLAILALAIYIAIVLTIFKITPVTLTLAGVAGFILSIGMAVDANVLIFERLKEELKNGRELSNAVEQGFKRAWTSIRDSNLSTLITCGILFWFGTSVIKGFALTLGIGILISMFSAIVITKTFLQNFNKTKSRWLFGVKK